VNDLVVSVVRVILIGLGATLTFDLWALILKLSFGITPSNICLVGRWIRYMPEGTYSHANIALSPPKRGECAVGWIAHYLIGITFAVAFVAFAGNRWLQHPTLLPALVFGVITVLAPFLIMQPSFGLGFAASKTANPTQARLRSLMNHAAFGIGLYVFALLVNRSLW
jgi:energy-converting hydrogenase Eha subunit B